MNNAHGFSKSKCSSCHYLVNIIENRGTVVVGTDNVVNVTIQKGRHVKRKEYFDRLEASECRRRKRSDRKRLKRLRRSGSRSTTPPADEDVRDATLNELALGSESYSFQQALQIFRCCITPLHSLRDNGCWAQFEGLRKSC